MQTKALLENAVLNSTSQSKKGILDRLFTIWFDRLVYPQIWEDPAVDVKALQIDENSNICTIASGSCNILNYLCHKPERICAVDLNEAHIALFHLKKTAIEHLPDYDSFFDFFGHADKESNIANYEKYIKPNLDEKTLAYWEGKEKFKSYKRILWFSKGFYRYGLLGEFIGFGHRIAKLLGGDLKKVMKAKNLEEQKELFYKYVAPVFDSKLIRFLSNNAITLYSLGIPPSQFEKMQEESGGKMNELLKERMRKLACDYDLSTNYFAWQAFGRCYDTGFKKAVPEYLKEENFQTLKENVHKISIKHCTMTDFLREQDDGSFDKFIFLDAQDWMDTATLNEMWYEIDRVAKEHARVIFRTAGEADILKGEIDESVIKHWSSDEAVGRAFAREDRSAIYGGFHLYIKG